MEQLLQSTAALVVGRGYLASDHVSTATGLDPAIMISKNGGAFANPAAGASVMAEIEATGWYKFSLSSADTDTLGPLIIRGTHVTMDNIEVVQQVIVAKAAAVTQVTHYAAGVFTCTIAETLSEPVVCTIAATWQKLYLTVKDDLSKADSAALLQMVVSNPAAATTDGVLYRDGAAATVAQRTMGSLAVAAGRDSVTVTVSDDLSAGLAAFLGATWDLKELLSTGGSKVVATGTWHFVYTPTKTI